MTAIPVPLVSFDAPDSPREQTRGYDGSLSRFGAPHAAPDLNNGPGRVVTQPTAELLVRVADLEAQRDAALESEAYASRRHLEEIAISRRMLDEVITLSGEVIARNQTIATLRARLKDQDRTIANLMLQVHELTRHSAARDCQIMRHQARIAELTRVRSEAPDTDVVDPLEWHSDPTPTPRVDSQTLDETVGGGR